MTRVYRAKDTRLDRTVAIKVLPSHLFGGSGTQEALRARSTLDFEPFTSNICALYDIGHQEDTDDP